MYLAKNLRLNVGLLFAGLLIGQNVNGQNVRQETILSDDWKFVQVKNKANFEEAEIIASVTYDDSKWESVRIPHDWAINGSFDKEIDKQFVAIEQNGEKTASEKTGRSGSLPWIGEGWYRTIVNVPKECKRAVLNFDGAMSMPVVYVNGKKAGEWKYGYNTFNVDITPFLSSDTEENTLAVHVENIDQSSRWYPGAGLYRPVTLITTSQTAIEQWGISANTTYINTLAKTAILDVSVKTVGYESKDLAVRCKLYSSDSGNNEVFVAEGKVLSDGIARMNIEVSDAKYWTPETPDLYKLCVKVYELNNGSENLVDEKIVKTGIRTVEVSAEKGFTLNGETRKIKGVCLHHDLGMLGAAINKAALARQLKLLKSMGCDAIRTAHNMPSQWQMDLCDSLGLMVMAESFDEWEYAKCKNGYHRFFDDWAERDLANLVLSNRLHPCIIMWSIGNEIPEQSSSKGAMLTKKLQDIIHSYDNTRPVTAGMDRIDNAISSGYAHVLDVPGMNYRVHKYEGAYKKLAQGFILGSETASTVSSRGVYKFPAENAKDKRYDDGQCSSYDLEACSWSNIPDEDWVLQEDKPWVIGEFVWTGFDYLGEPSPYDNYWPSRSSYFGIFDLAGLPKDRYFLYRSRWNETSHTIHLLPHWNWQGREGEITPVYCYTDYPEAELFVNGKSMGKRKKNVDVLSDRYRLHWDSVRYEPGELKVVAYDSNGNIAGNDVVKTSGKPYGMELVADRGTGGSLVNYDSMSATDNPSFFQLGGNLKADGEDMAFVSIRIVDKAGNFCPLADNKLTFKVDGAGVFKGVCNGDATSLEVFTKPTMKAFNGELVVGILTKKTAGKITLTVKGEGLKTSKIVLYSLAE